MTLKRQQNKKYGGNLCFFPDLAITPKNAHIPWSSFLPRCPGSADVWRHSTGRPVRRERENKYFFHIL